MKIKTQITKDQIVINTALKDSTFKDIQEYIAIHNLDWKGLRVIWDMSAFNFKFIKANHVQNLIENLKSFSEIRANLKTCVVVKSDVGYGMMRMFSMMSEGFFHFTIEVFRDLPEAIEWIKSE